MADDSMKAQAGGEGIKFVGDAIYGAIKELQTNQQRLTREATGERNEVENAIKRLQEVSKAVESKCFPTWFLAPK